MDIKKDMNNNPAFAIPTISDLWTEFLSNKEILSRPKQKPKV